MQAGLGHDEFEFQKEMIQDYDSYSNIVILLFAALALFPVALFQDVRIKVVIRRRYSQKEF